MVEGDEDLTIHHVAEREGAIVIGSFPCGTTLKLSSRGW